jgi:HAD superfamily hydrolase (TIGR01544 family)
VNTLTEKIKNIEESSSANLVCVFDFSKTMTLPFFEGKKAGSTFAQFRDLNLIDDSYTTEAKKLFDEYYPFEISTEISLEEKKRKLKDWWIKHFELLIKFGVNKTMVQGVAEMGNIKLRDKVKELFVECKDKNIPIIIISGGVGSVILAILEKERINFPNVFVESTFFIWDESGNAAGFSSPVIHTLNKKEVELSHATLTNLMGRENVLLAGDSVRDLDMTEGVSVKNILSVGYLNDIRDSEEEFNKNYDLVLKSKDADFSFILDIVKKMI